MVKELIHDPIFLACKSEEADAGDAEIAQNLLDTIKAHNDECVGMAANMIGVRKRIIVVYVEENCKYLTMLNPVILKQSEPYDTEESCLSLLGAPRKCRRYNKIKVQYQTLDMQTRIKTFTGFTAQIIQHETDHCNGVLI